MAERTLSLDELIEAQGIQPAHDLDAIGALLPEGWDCDAFVDLRRGYKGGEDMAYGDVGGAVTELVITCVTLPEGLVDIVKGMALTQTEEDYGVDQWNAYGERLFGQALASCNMNDKTIPVKVRGICIFCYDDRDDLPVIGDRVMMSSTNGLVCGADDGSPNGVGRVLKVDTADCEVHVLL